MATRSTPTSVLVTLSLFVILTIGLAATLAIGYSTYQKVTSDSRDAASRFNEIATSSDLGSSDVETLKAGARAANKSLVAYLIELNHQFSGQLTGDRNKVLSDTVLAKVTKDLGVPEGGSLNTVVIDLRKSHESALGQLDRLQKDLQTVNAQLKAAGASKAGEGDNPSLARATQLISDLADAASGYRKDAGALTSASDTAKSDFEKQVVSVRDERDQTVDALTAKIATLETQLEEARKKLSSSEMVLQNPALAVDGHVIEVNAGDGQVFIDLGKPQHLQAGTTFQVFETPEQIRAAGEQGARSKATLQVTRVGEDSSLARVTRQSPGKPVVRGDLLVNAAYSPLHKYRFLVHGLFSIDGDGLPSSTETELVMQRIRDWGGDISDKDRVTGDLDFVVLGDPPRDLPVDLPATASGAEIAAHQKAKAAKAQYDQIFNDAKQAHIPVLNWSRLQALTGMTTD